MRVLCVEVSQAVDIFDFAKVQESAKFHIVLNERKVGEVKTGYTAEPGTYQAGQWYDLTIAPAVGGVA